MRLTILVLFIAVVFGGCAAGERAPLSIGALAPSPSSSGPTGKKPLRPLIIGWEQYFKLDWQAGARGGSPVLEGHLFNDGGFTATHVRLLVDGVDAAGNIVDQQVVWLGTPDVTPGTRTPFEITLARAAAGYRVSVFSFDWVQRGGGGSIGSTMP